MTAEIYTIASLCPSWYPLKIKMCIKPNIPKPVLSLTDFVILFRDFSSSLHFVISFRHFFISPNTESRPVRLLSKLRPCEIWITLNLNFQCHSIIKCSVTADFLLASNSKHLSISRGLDVHDVICTWKVPYHLAKVLDKRCKNQINSSWLSHKGYHQK